METTAKPLHLGRKISRLRELRGMKQEALAFELGVSQQTVSRMEGSEVVDEDTLVKVAKALDVSVEAIKNFSEDVVMNVISNTFSDFKDNASAINYNCDLNFNPLDKLMEAHEENKTLYERLVQAEKEKVALLEQLLKGK